MREFKVHFFGRILESKVNNSCDIITLFTIPRPGDKPVIIDYSFISLQIQSSALDLKVAGDCPITAGIKVFPLKIQ